MSKGPAQPRPVTPVGLVAQTLVRLRDRLDAGEPLGDDLALEVRRAAEIATGLDPYLGHCTTPESPALSVLARRTAEADWSARGGDQPFVEQEMLSGHVEGQVLAFLVRMSGARRVLDVGMFTGYSALAMAEALPEGGEVVACELDSEVARFAQDCFAESASGRRIRVEVGPAQLSLQRLADAGEVFDLVFLDADKAGYAGYLDHVLETGLLAPRGVVAADNTLMQGEPYLGGGASANGAAIADFNEAVAADPRVEQVLLPLRDGLTLIRRADDDV